MKSAEERYERHQRVIGIQAIDRMIDVLQRVKENYESGKFKHRNDKAEIDRAVEFDGAEYGIVKRRPGDYATLNITLTWKDREEE